MKDSLVQELQQKAEETELLQMELQMLETERVRLSLVEEKLVDILQLLQQLRDLVSSSHLLYKTPTAESEEIKAANNQDFVLKFNMVQTCCFDFIAHWKIL